MPPSWGSTIIEKLDSTSGTMLCSPSRVRSFACSVEGQARFIDEVETFLLGREALGGEEGEPHGSLLCGGHARGL